MGNPAEPDTIIGPMITTKQIDKIVKILDNCEKEGAKIVVRGKVEGNMMWPSVVKDVTNDMTIARPNSLVLSRPFCLWTVKKRQLRLRMGPISD